MSLLCFHCQGKEAPMLRKHYGHRSKLYLKSIKLTVLQMSITRCPFPSVVRLHYSQASPSPVQMCQTVAAAIFASTGSVLLALCIHSIGVFCGSPSLAHVSVMHSDIMSWVYDVMENKHAQKKYMWCTRLSVYKCFFLQITWLSYTHTLIYWLHPWHGSIHRSAASASTLHWQWEGHTMSLHLLWRHCFLLLLSCQ